MLENILRDLLKVRLTEVLKRDNGTDEILSIVNEINGYNEDRVYYIFNYVEENNNLKIISIEDIIFYGGK